MLDVKCGKRLRLKEGILIRPVSEIDRYYIFDLRGGDHFECNYAAYWVLQSIGKGVDFSELYSKFTDRFELDDETAERDLEEVLRFAVENHIIEEAVI